MGDAEDFLDELNKIRAGRHVCFYCYDVVIPETDVLCESCRSILKAFFESKTLEEIMSEIEEFLASLEEISEETNWAKTVSCRVCEKTKEVPVNWQLKKTCKECFDGWRTKYTGH